MRRALLVLDMADDLVGSEGPLAAAGYGRQVAERDVCARVRDAVRWMHDRDELVVWVTVGFMGDYVDWPAGSPLLGGARVTGAFRLETPGSAPSDGLGRKAADPVVVKPRVSPFFGTRIEVLLRTQGVGEVVLCGVATEHVVLAAARDAHDRDLQVTVLTDAVASSSSRLHEAALEVMTSYTRQVSTAAWSTGDAR